MLGPVDGMLDNLRRIKAPSHMGLQGNEIANGLAIEGMCLSPFRDIVSKEVGLRRPDRLVAKLGNAPSRHCCVQVEGTLSAAQIGVAGGGGRYATQRKCGVRVPSDNKHNHRKEHKKEPTSSMRRE